MKRSAVVAVTMLAGIAVLVALTGTGSANHPGSQTLTFVERDNQGTFKFIDMRPKSTRRGEPSISPGDEFVGSNPLYNASNSRRVGRLFFKCTAILRRARFNRSTFLCEATARLSNGQLAINAVLKGGVPAGPVTGGTGAYEGASGSFRSVERRRTSLDIVHIDTD